MTTETDVVVIGAGPAGLAAARAAADHGLKVTLLDEQPAAGGQIYRGIAYRDAELDAILGDDYVAGRKLLDALGQPGVTHVAQATVWDITRKREVFYSHAGRADVIQSRQVIIATGAQERPMPFAGWQLPGVMTAGAGQILLKTAGVLAEAPLVLAGSGPLLLLLAAQYLRAGQSICAIVETTTASDKFSALKHAPGMLGCIEYLSKGLGLLSEIRKHNVTRYAGVTALRAVGDAEIESLEFRHRGRTTSLPCRTLLVHSGVVPNVQLTRLLEIDHRFDDLQRCWHPVTDQYGNTELAGIAVAGDSASIAGAETAQWRGALCGHSAALALGSIDEAAFKNLTAPLMQQTRRHLKARPFLDALYPPPKETLTPADDVIVCRCEEVRAGTIREYVDLGCVGPNQTKAFGRCGMGPCQGRQCGLTVSEIIAERRGVNVAGVGSYRVRPPIKPVTLGEIASMADRETD